jgi:hypothetical protein
MNLDIPFSYDTSTESAASPSRPGDLTGKELLEMFGSRMPSEAVKLLENPGDRTKADLRCELRAIASGMQKTRDKLSYGHGSIRRGGRRFGR